MGRPLMRPTVLIVGEGHKAKALAQSFILRRCQVILVPRIPNLEKRHVMIEDIFGDHNLEAEWHCKSGNGRLKRRARSGSFSDNLYNAISTPGRKMRKLYQKSISQSSDAGTGHKRNEELLKVKPRKQVVVDRIFPELKNSIQTSDNIVEERKTLRNMCLREDFSYLSIAESVEDLEATIKKMKEKKSRFDFLPVVFLTEEYQFTMSNKGLMFLSSIKDVYEKLLFRRGVGIRYCFYRHKPTILKQLNEIGIQAFNVMTATCLSFPIKYGDKTIIKYPFGASFPIYVAAVEHASDFDILIQSLENVFERSLNKPPYKESIDSAAYTAWKSFLSLNVFKTAYDMINYHESFKEALFTNMFIGNTAESGKLHDILAPFYVSFYYHVNGDIEKYKTEREQNLNQERYRIVAKAIKEILTEVKVGYWNILSSFMNETMLKEFEKWLLKKMGDYQFFVQTRELQEAYESRLILKAIIDAGCKNNNPMKACQQIFYDTQANFMNATETLSRSKS